MGPVGFGPTTRGIQVQFQYGIHFEWKIRGEKVGPSGFKGEGDFRSPIAQPSAPPDGSGNGGIGALFALNPEVIGRGARTACQEVADKGFIPSGNN